MFTHLLWLLAVITVRCAVLSWYLRLPSYSLFNKYCIGIAQLTLTIIAYSATLVAEQVTSCKIILGAFDPRLLFSFSWLTNF